MYVDGKDIIVGKDVSDLKNLILDPAIDAVTVVDAISEIQGIRGLCSKRKSSGRCYRRI